jgi:hypothetical protein
MQKSPILLPVQFGAQGHYSVTHRCALVNAQAANSRIFELRNTGTGLIILTSLVLKWLQTGAHTAAIEDSLDAYKVTGFTAVDTTNTVTPVASVKHGGVMVAPASANVAIRGVTVAGAAAGMTGGTLTKDTAPFAQLPKWLLAAVPTGSINQPEVLNIVGDNIAEHPFVFKQNEGFIVENRVLLGAAAASAVYVECEFAEVAQN